MEITAEITKDEYEQVIRNYYLGKDWVKRIAILALIALGLALLGVTSYRWRILYSFFDAYFLFLFLFFFALPYGIRYIQMRQAIKDIAYQPEKWLFNITEAGIHANNNEVFKYYQWPMINKLYRAGEYIIVKPMSGRFFCLPVALLHDQDADAFLAIAAHYRRKPGGRMNKPTPST